MSWVRIDSTTLESAAASVSINVPTTYDFLRATVYVANDGSSKTVYLRLNNDTGNNFGQQYLMASNTTVSGSRSLSNNIIGLNGTSLAANEEASFQILIAKPAAGVKAQVIVLSGVNASPALAAIGAEWNNTADEITSVQILSSGGNLAAGTSILLEGLAF